jgi:hypothetical protein
MKNLDHLAAGYREEASERLAELEATLLALDDRPDDADLVDQAFRAAGADRRRGARAVRLSLQIQKRPSQGVPRSWPGYTPSSR